MRAAGLTRDQESQLFDYLCRHKPLQVWLDEQMQKQVDILLVNPDAETIRKAQGAAGFIKMFGEKLQAATELATRK